MTKKQQETIQLIEWFIPENVEWTNKVVFSLGFSRISIAEEADDGISSKEAFFLKTERGIDAPKVKNVPRLEALLSGHKWMTVQEKMWSKCFKEGTLSLPNGPECVRKFAFKIYLSHLYLRKSNYSTKDQLPIHIGIKPNRYEKTFHFSRYCFLTLCIRVKMMGYYSHRVPPFGLLRVNASFQLAEAYRRLARPSSPIDTKASTNSP